MTKLLFLIITISLASGLFSILFAHSGRDEKTDPSVHEAVQKWQDLKFGLLMHWGPYSVWGVVESWSICSEDWIHRHRGRNERYGDYKKDYRNLQKTFNPEHFDPGNWVAAAENAGMKYVIFTTKHHDGFCMFNTKTTDYRITSKECPFHSNPKGDITREIFNAFRKKDFLIGAYFSKPDWDCEFYWWPYYATPDRHVNYDPAKHPERWNKFKDFTYRQIEELMTGYGRIHILWLDGAWVRPLENMPKEFESWAKKKNYNQDIDMERIATMARKHQPGLIIVDRWVSGSYENYATPENRIPESALPYPWESCIPMAEGWSHAPNQKYKSVRRLVHMLVKIVAKGGNFLLNIGPSPDGTWAEEAYERLEGIGAWMRVNGEAIYGTRPAEPHSEDNIFFTRKKEGVLYAIYLIEQEEKSPPDVIRLASVQPKPDGSITLLGSEEKLQWEAAGKGCRIHIPKSIRTNPPCMHGWTIKISPAAR